VYELNSDPPKKKRTVGVLGGMGPQATVDFMTKVIAMTPADVDHEHIRMLVDNNPGVPDRQAAILGDDASVRQALVAMAQQLQAAGADFLVMPCNTAHAFVSDAVESVRIPFLHIVNETVAEIETEHPETRKVGVLATDACLVAGVYQTALQSIGRTAVFPQADDQRECMQLIGLVKSGDTGESVQQRMTELAERLIAAGAELVVAGCTEIPLVLGNNVIKVPVVSSTDVLANRTVAIATGAVDLPAID
jgi:aspartate racemase